VPVAREAGGAFAAQLLGHFLRYGSSIVLTRALGLSWFGSFTVGFTIVQLLSMVATVGLSPGLLPFIARTEKRGRRAVRSVIQGGLWIGTAASITAGIALYACTPWLATRVFDDPQLVHVLRPFALFVVLSTISNIATTLVQGLCGVRQAMWITWLVGPGVTLVGFALAWIFGWGYRGVLPAVLAGPLLTGIVSLSLLRRHDAEAFRTDSRDRMPLSELVRSSWPLMGSSMFAFLLMWMDVLLMGVFRTNDEVGVYGACARIAPAIVMVNMSVGPVFLTRMSRLFVSRDWKAADRLYKLAGSWSLWAGTLIAALLFVWGPNFLALFGPEFTSGAPVLYLLAAGRLASAVTGMCGRMLVVTDRARLHLVNTSLLVGFNAALDLYLIPRYGAVGAATATCISVVLVNTLQSIQVWVIFRVQPFTLRTLSGFAGLATLAVLFYPWRDGPSVPFGWVLPAALFLACSTLFYWKHGAGSEERSYLAELTGRLSGRS